MLKNLDGLEKEQANLNSVTTARLTALVLQIAHGFSGSKKAPPAFKPSDFMPFPDWERGGTSKKEGPDGLTKELLGQLVRERRIPMHVFTSLISEVEKQ